MTVQPNQNQFSPEQLKKNYNDLDAAIQKFSRENMGRPDWAVTAWTVLTSTVRFNDNDSTTFGYDYAISEGNDLGRVLGAIQVVSLSMQKQLLGG